MLCDVCHFGGSRCVLRASLRVRQGRGRTVRRLGRTGLRFFSGVSRRFEAPLALVVSRVRLLLRDDSLSPSMCGGLLGMCGGACRVQGLVDRLLSFHGLRRKRVGLGICRRSVIPFLGRVCLSFCRCTSDHSVACGFATPRRGILYCFSPGRVRGIFCGLLSGTFGCAGPGTTVRVVLRGGRGRIAVGIVSGNVNVDGRSVSGVFSQFCRTRGNVSGVAGAPDAKVKLSLAGDVVRLRRKAVRIRDAPNCNDVFVIRLRGNCARFARRRLTRGRRGGRARDLVPSAITFSSRVRRFSSARRGRLLVRKSSSPRAVLLIRSGRRLLRVLGSLFSPACHILLTQGNGRKLRGTHTRQPSVVIDSIVVPRVSKARVYLGVGGSFSMYRVPIMLLATLASTRRGVRNLRQNTSSCVGGPFGTGMLLTHYGGLIHGHVVLRGGFDRRGSFSTRSLTDGPVSRGFLSAIGSVVRGGLSGVSFSVGVVTHRLKLDQDSLCTGFGTLANVAPGSFILGYGLGQTTAVLARGPSLRVTSVSSQLNFNSPHCFAHYFGTRFRVAPTRCEGGAIVWAPKSSSIQSGPTTISAQECGQLSGRDQATSYFPKVRVLS